MKEEDVKSPSEVSVEWLKGILESEGYKVEGRDNPLQLLARHEQRPNMVVDLRRDVSLITVQAFFTIKKPGWGQKNEFLAAVNKANGTHFLCTCFAPEALDSLGVSSFIFLTERLSSRDVAAFLQMFSDGVQSTFDRSGLRKFA